ncbi:MAG: hypothetical protein IJE07_02600 [Clostridia bacterium]|nr:hypothetical protein [Clostridia bacterium]
MRKAASVLQIIHILCCVFSLLMMAVYPPFQGSEAGMVILMLSITPVCICLLFPVGLVGCVMQIIRCIRFRKQDGRRAPAGLIVWAILGPVVCAVLWMAAVIVWVESTGGV